jgi:hypothetical protein
MLLTFPPLLLAHELLDLYPQSTDGSLQWNHLGHDLAYPERQVLIAQRLDRRLHGHSR